MKNFGIAVLFIFISAIPAFAMTFDTLPSYQDEGMKLYSKGTQKIQEGDLIGAVELLKKAVQLRSDLPEAFHNLGYAFEKTGDLRNAAEAYGKAIDLKPTYASALNNLGYLLAVTEKELPKALQFCQRAVELEPNSASFRDSLGWAFYKLGRLDQAFLHFQTAARLDPSFAKARFNMGLCEFQRKSFGAASKHFAATLQINPNFFKAYIPLGACYEELKMNNKAVYVYQQAMTKAPEHSAVRRHLDRQIKRLSENSKSYYFSNVKNIQASSKLTNFLRKKSGGSLRDKTQSKYETFPKSNSTFTPAYETPGSSPSPESVDLGMGLSRVPMIKTIVSDVPPIYSPGSFQQLSISKERELEKRYSLSHSYVERGLIQEAAAELEKIVALGGDSGVGRQARNELLRVKKMLDERTQGRAETHMAMGKDFFRSGKYDFAEAEMNKALSLNPGNAEVHKDLALLFYNQGRLKEAYEESKRAIALDRGIKEAYIVLGSLYSKKGRIDDALRILRKVREIPGGRDAVDELAERMINTLTAGT